MAATPKGQAPFDLYAYNPAQAPAYAFLGLFGFAAVLHSVFMPLYRAAFPLPLVIGCIMEAAGYYFRSQSHNNLRKILPFIIQNLLLLSAPPFLAATIYMSPGRIMHALNAEEHSLLSPRWQTKLFVLIDLACFVTQVKGAIMSGSEDPSEASRGRTTVLTGLIIQVGAFAVFIISVFTFQIRLRRTPTALSEMPGLSWRRYLGGLYAVSILFLIRNLIRIVEFNQGSDGYIITHESMLYAFDACFMLAVVVIMLLVHPGRLIRKARRVAKGKQLENELGLLS